MLLQASIDLHYITVFHRKHARLSRQYFHCVKANMLKNNNQSSEQYEQWANRTVTSAN